MARILEFAMLLFLFGSLFAGTIVNVGETVPVGGTTTTTTPEPEPEPEPEPTDTGGPGGMVLTNDEGDSIEVGTDQGSFEVLESGEGEEPSAEADSGEGALGIGVPAGSSEPAEESACGTAFVLLGLAALFAKGN